MGGSVGVLHGIAHSIVLCAEAFAFLFASIRCIALAVRDDPVRSQVVARDELHGWSAAAAGELRRRRR